MGEAVARKVAELFRLRRRLIECEARDPRAASTDVAQTAYDQALAALSAMEMEQYLAAIGEE